ncbi:kelch-like protein 2 isoform X2 [Ornithodoros turicata]|uniref:kelch-like protein 2 isoform X2 n=1 Tax=Ornithodoros turicata TaxID=34597 RepID=UPI003139257D
MSPAYRCACIDPYPIFFSIITHLQSTRDKARLLAALLANCSSSKSARSTSLPLTLHQGRVAVSRRQGVKLRRHRLLSHRTENHPENRKPTGQTDLSPPLLTERGFAHPRRSSPPRSLRHPMLLPDVPGNISLEEWSVNACYIEDIVYPSQRNRSYQTSSCVSAAAGSSPARRGSDSSLHLSSTSSSDETSFTFDTTSPRRRAAALGSQESKKVRILFKKNENTDLSVYVRGQQFFCHKAVLSVYSEFFDGIIKGKRTISEMDLKGVSPNAFRDILDYMYTGKLKITCQNVGKLYVTASILKISKVKKKCAKILTKSPYDPKHAICVYVTARKYGLGPVCQRVLTLLHNRLEETITCKPFLDLDVEQVCQVLSGDPVGARGEMVIFLAALHWLNHNYLAYEAHVLQVLQCVRFVAMSMEELISCLHPPVLPGIMEIHEVRAYIQKAICYKVAADYNQANLFSDIQTKPRHFLLDGPVELWVSFSHCPYYMHVSLVIQIWCDFLVQDMSIFDRKATKCSRYPTYRNDSARKVFQLEPLTPSFNLLNTTDPLAEYLLSNLHCSPNISEERELANVKGSVFDGQSPVLLAVGGFDPNRPNEVPIGTKILRYHIQWDAWEFFDSFPMSRHHHSVVLHQDKLYIIGGYDGYETARGTLVPTAMCFMFDLGLRGWKPLASMAHARVYHSATILGDAIYVVGGKDHNGRAMSSIEKFCPNGNKQWQELSVLLCRPRMAAASAQHRGLLYIVGGLVESAGTLIVLADVDCLDPRTNELSFHVSHLPSPRCFLSLLAVDDQLFALGGCWVSEEGEGLKSSADVFVYGEDERWEHAATLDEPRHDFAAAAIGRSMFLVGGLTSIDRSACSDVWCYTAANSRVVQQPPRAPLRSPLCGVGLVTIPRLHRGNRDQNFNFHFP